MFAFKIDRGFDRQKISRKSIKPQSHTKQSHIGRKFRTATLQTVISYEGTKEIIRGSRSGFPFRRGDETLGTLISLSLACMGRHVQLTGFVMPEKLGASSTAMSLFESSQAARRLVTFVQVKQTLFDSSITGVGLNPFYIESCRGCT